MSCKLMSKWLALAVLPCMAIAHADTNAPAPDVKPSADAKVPQEADAAWKEVLKAVQPPPFPEEWSRQAPTEEQRADFKAEKGRMAAIAADKAKDFYTRFPDHPKAEEARKKYQQMLQTASNLGNKDRQGDLEKAQEEQLKNPKLSEEERFRLKQDIVKRRLEKKKSEGRDAYLDELEKVGRELMSEFPDEDLGYRYLMGAAGEMNETKMRMTARQIIALTNAPTRIKEEMQVELQKFEALGKPVEIKFTALDGKEVDVTKMKGKVVLIDFWATWCGPCVAEIPRVKEAYEGLHGKGFEIVGISFDSDKDKLKEFIAEKEMPWPQYFDGQGWANKFGKQYGINSIPTMWLVDKKGVLREMNARSGLQKKVEELLAE